MAFLTLPIHSDFPSYSFKIELSSILYTLSFSFNFRTEYWVMDIQDTSGSVIQAGIPVLVKQDLLGRFADSRLPPGDLLAINLETENVEATRDNFGTSVVLLYNE